MEDERAGGSTLQEAAAKLSLPYRVVDAVAADLTAPDGSAISDLPGGAAGRERGFRQRRRGREQRRSAPTANSWVFYDVLGITPARDRSLDEVRADVVKAWTEAETEKRVTELADKLFERLKNGTPLATLAAEIGKTVQTVEGVKRNGSSPGLTPNAINQAFAGPEGHVADADGVGHGAHPSKGRPGDRARLLRRGYRRQRNHQPAFRRARRRTFSAPTTSSSLPRAPSRSTPPPTNSSPASRRRNDAASTHAAAMQIEPSYGSFEARYSRRRAAARLHPPRLRPRDAGLRVPEARGKQAQCLPARVRWKAAPCAAAIRCSASTPTSSSALKAGRLRSRARRTFHVSRPVRKTRSRRCAS